ncbi:hypothetical protein [Pelosinus sp. UFO1]|uniref:hypothetical protein n=1 Tax=Pelosinus sp. UFO1 TaxID=484770 RepID=UPI0004D17C5C|nr:hypothetical protein [Pelosinus sp. UFO1]AIF51830.1 hypothetical protein UFO1_2283 [Pelosinus sp. UFO1]
MYLPNWKDTIHYIKKDKWYFTYGLLVTFILFTGLLFYHYYIIPQLPAPPPTPGIMAEELLGKEFGLLTTLSGTALQHYASSHKRTLAYSQGSYKTNKSYREIRAFYIEEAKKNGWTFVTEEHLNSDSSEHIQFRKDGPQKADQFHIYSFQHKLSIYYFSNKNLFTVDLTSNGHVISNN